MWRTAYEMRCKARCWPAGRVLLALALLAGTAASAEPLPIFDTHIHYSSPAWPEYDPPAIRAKLDAAHVLRALVSSTPDDGTLRLHGLHPHRFVPVLRPYRAGVHSGNWFHDAPTADYVAARLRQGSYQGIGEFHLHSPEQARTDVVRKVARMAVERGIVLHVHADAAPVAALFALEPELKILWGHAGMVTPPEDIRRMMDRFANLWAELSFREGEILGSGDLHGAWRPLLIAHSGRFMIGSDTYTNSRWEAYEAIIADHRRWLARLPAEVARAIAYRNAVRLFGAGGIERLRD